jgi:hypothetical protein
MYFDILNSHMILSRGVLINLHVIVSCETKITWFLRFNFKFRIYIRDKRNVLYILLVFISKFHDASIPNLKTLSN